MTKQKWTKKESNQGEYMCFHDLKVVKKKSSQKINQNPILIRKLSKKSQGLFRKYLNAVYDFIPKNNFLSLGIFFKAILDHGTLIIY